MTVAVTVDVAALEGWLATRIGEPVRVDGLERPPSGQSNDTWLFTANGTPYVLRRQPTANQIFLTPDVIREGQVVQALAGTGVPAPRVLWIEPSSKVLDAPFFVMEHVSGTVPMGKPSIHQVGWLPTLTPAQLSTLWSSALDALVAVHAVDWRTTHPFLIDGSPSDALRTYVKNLADWYGWTTRGREYPITDAALSYLHEHVAHLSVEAPVLVWRDARVGNMIFGADHRVAAVIDWEIAAIGAPEIDIAHWLFFDEFATSAIDVARLEGWPDRETTIEEYERRSGRTLGDLRFFDVMDAFFMATTLIRQADIRVENGVAVPGTRMGHDNTVTQMLARLLGLPVPEASHDYLVHRGVRVVPAE